MTINIQRNIDAPSDALWSYLSDYANIHKFHPLLKGSHFIEGANTCEIGATRQCDMKDGNYLKERITDWKEGSHYTVDVYETSMPVERAVATLGVKALRDQSSEVYMRLQMTPTYKILQPVMFLFFRYVAGPGILKGLEQLYRREQELRVA